jgi:hypothetical protein
LGLQVRRLRRARLLGLRIIGPVGRSCAVDA